MIIKSYFLFILAIFLAGCDLRGGSRTQSLTPFDRCRFESIKALLNEIKETKDVTNGKITIPFPPNLDKETYLRNRDKFSYLYRHDEDGVLIFESKYLYDAAEKSDIFRKDLLSIREDGEIRFLSLSEWKSEIDSNGSYLKPVLLEHKDSD